MENIVIKSNKDELVLKLNRQFFNSNYLIALVKRIQMEEIAQKSEFDPAILDLANEINQSWWEKNGDDFLKDVKK